MHQRRTHPRRAGGLVDTLQGPAQRIFADHLVHSQRLCGHCVAAQCGDVGIAPVPGQHPHHQRAQHVTFVRRVAASVRQRALRDPAIEHASGSQELCEENQLAVRRGRRTFVPAHVHSSAQRVHHLRLIAALFDPGQGPHSPAFAFTHRVSLPNRRKPASALD